MPAPIWRSPAVKPRPAAPGSTVIIEMPKEVEPVPRSQPVKAEPMFTPQRGRATTSTARAGSSTPDWYADWQATTTPDVWARQQTLIEVVGDGDAFFRAEIIEALKDAGLLNDDPSAPGWTARQLFTSLNDLGLIEEIDGGYGASVPKAITLTDRGRAAYERLTGRALPRSPWARLLDRHKTPEHTVLNVLARNVLRRFQYTAIDLFPESLRTPAGSLVIPDLTAVSPDGQMLLIECERLAKHRTADERRNKWGDLAALTQGQLHVVVPGRQQERDLITEISQWILETGTKRAHLSVCRYPSAIRPQARTPWTYTTAWHIA